MRVLLPPEMFPLPPSPNPQDAANAKAASDLQKQRAADEQAMKNLAQQIEDSRNAIVEVSRALRADTNDLKQARSKPVPEPAPAIPATAPAGGGVVVLTPGAVSPGVLSAKEVGRHSAPTKHVLGAIGVTTEFIDVPYAVQSLESSIAEASAQLFQGRNSRVVTRVGNRWIPAGSDRLAFGDLWSAPGPCAMVASDDPGGDAVTVPATTISTIRSVGLADLSLVRQEIKRFEMGEIAHLENVMKGESRSRKHREIDQTTETVTVETETTTEESRDLETADRSCRC